MREKTLLVITEDYTDDLAMRLASSALYGNWGKVVLEFTQGDAALPLRTEYEAVYGLRADGSIDFLAGQAPQVAAATFGYTTVIARPENFSSILRAQVRRDEQAALDGLRLSADKNEWIEAGFAASELAESAPCPALRRLVVLPGKNYQLDEECDLFEATLHNGAVVESSDLRCYYFLREAICWEKANFTKQQLNEVAKLPATLTPVYVHGNGDVTLSAAYAADMEGELRFRGGAAVLQQDVFCAGQRRFSRLSGLRAKAATLLGQPQPGDALELVPERASQAA